MKDGSQSEDLSTPKSPVSTTDRIFSWLLPNPGDILFILIISFLLFLRPDFVFGDGSTGWHIATGDFVLHHGVPHHDFLSYTFPGKDWVAYEWLSDTLFAGIVNLAGGNLMLLAVCISCSIGALMIMLYSRCRNEGANFPLAFSLVVIGAIISAIHWLARPHIFTFFGVYFFSTLLEDFWSGKLSGRRLLLQLSLIAIIWVNVHPAFLLAFAITGIYWLSALASVCYCWKTEAFSGCMNRLKICSAALIVCLLATCLNPYGLKLYSYLVEYFKGGVTEATSEFLSPVFHGALQPLCLEVLIALLLLGLGVSRARLSLPRLVLCVAFLHLSLSAVRNMPLFVLIVLPAISKLSSRLAIDEVILPAGSVPAEVFRRLGDKLRNLDKGFYENEVLCGKHMVSLAIFICLVIASLNGGNFLGQKLLTSGWSEDDKPTLTVEYLRREFESHRLDVERGFNYDNWGGYLYYVLKKPVAMDDRADFYGRPFYYKYTIVVLNQPGWKEQLDGEFFKETAKAGTNVQWLLMPRGSAINKSLSADPGWGPPVKTDRASELFVRK
ncbi:MAG: hypothetical protein U0103_20415 [Candidatus Obscuribacterales bacterium]